MSYNTAILLITFNRPEHTRKVFEIIKKQQPTQLFVFQDGERNGNAIDKENCQAVRAIFDEKLEWPCELHKNFSPVNLGCGKGPSTAISWFFDHVEQGIIFEDDCLPHPDFFEYTETLLNKYKDDSGIAFIGGSSFQNQQIQHKESYYYSCGSFGTWGWATWKRTWMHFDYYIESIDRQVMDKIIKSYFPEIRQRAYWRNIYNQVKKDRYNESCWDYQFYFCCWQHDMVAIIPNTNLITNIGYDDLGTHTVAADHPAANVTTNSILPLKHPEKIILNKKADLYVQRHYTNPLVYGLTGFKRIPFYVNKWLKQLAGHEGSWLR